MIENQTTKKVRNEGLMIFENKDLSLQLRTVLNADGSISISAEDAAIGFGWSRLKNGKNYVMWDRLNAFCEELGFPHKCGKDDYIPESLYYLLAMKASNEKAQKFQRWLALEVIPTIRKTGSYNVGQPATEAESTKYIDPYTALEAAKIIATMPDSKRQVINCLRHVVPDIDFDVTDVKTETDVKTSSTKKSLRYVKEGVDIDVNKLLLEIASQRISIPVLAKRANVSVKSVTGWIAGEHRPVLQNRINICVALGKDKDFLTPRRTRNVME